MNILQSLILGIIEGLTEFLPISSTFHLIFGSRLMGIESTSFVKLFEVFIQAGAILALLSIYLKVLISNRSIFLNVIYSFLPTAIVGAVLYKVIKGVFFGNDPLMLGVFIGIGLLFLLVEHLVSRKVLVLRKTMADLTPRDSLLIGLAQSFAVIPGVSRAGSVILGMMGLGYKREDAAIYTFLLSIPTIFAASAYDLYKQRELLSATGNEVLLLSVGFVSAFVVAYFVVNWFLEYLKNGSLRLFAWYRFAVALILLLYLYA